MKSTKEFAKLLKASRIRVRLSQTELATKLRYVSPQIVSNWERAIVTPPIDTLPKLCTILDLPIDEVKSTLVKIFEKNLNQRI